MKKDSSEKVKIITDINETFNDPYLSPDKIKRVMSSLGKKNINTFIDMVIDLRKTFSEKIPLEDQKGNYFWYNENNEIKSTLYKISTEFKDSVFGIVGDKIEHDFKESSLIKDSLLEEAFYSSQIEGAVTTYMRAKEIVDHDVQPKNKSEQMFVNNYNAMRYIEKIASEELSIDIIFELHRIVTQKTLESKFQGYSGKFRDYDGIEVIDETTGETVYVPPHYTKIEKLMGDLVSWSNTTERFIHPVIKASILHFYLTYIHPFVDGNGRTARALFYYYLIKHDYSILKFLSISSVIAKHKNLYYRTLKEVEDNDSDLTYFLVFSAKATYEAFENMSNKMLSKIQIEFFLEKIRKDNLNVNQRQIKIMKGFYLKRYQDMSIEKLNKISGVSEHTVRKDVKQLVEWNFLSKTKKGRKFYYSINEKD